MSKKEEWEIEYDKKQKELSVGVSKLSKEQIESIDTTIATLFDILNTVSECFDIEISDIRKMQDCVWDLNHKFQYQKRHKTK